MKTPELPESHPPKILILHLNQSVKPSEFAAMIQGIRPDLRARVDSLDLIGNSIQNAEKIQRVREEINPDMEIRTGSGLMVLDEKTQAINEDARIQAILLDNLFDLIQFIQKKGVKRVLALCFSTQILSVACNALTQLVLAGVDPTKIETLEQLKKIIAEKGAQKIWNDEHPMRVLQTPQLGVLPNHINSPHSLSAINRGQIDLIHMHRQAIDQKRMAEIADTLKELITLNLMMHQTVEVQGEIQTIQIVTGLEIFHATGAEGSYEGYQGHPESGGKQKKEFIERLNGLLEKDKNALSDYAATPEACVESLTEISGANDQGHLLMNRFWRPGAEKNPEHSSSTDERPDQTT